VADSSCFEGIIFLGGW